MSDRLRSIASRITSKSRFRSLNIKNMQKTLTSFLEKFSLSVILGSAVGALFVGYMVSAVFDPPTAFPPANNVEPPINTSDASQVKEGELIVNGGYTSGDPLTTGLRVRAYTQLEVLSVAPAPAHCSVPTEGRTILYNDGIDERLYVCVSSTWKFIDIP